MLALVLLMNIAIYSGYAGFWAKVLSQSRDTNRVLPNLCA